MDVEFRRDLGIDRSSEIAGIRARGPVGVLIFVGIMR
jgi:hypothetical protein